MTERDRLDQLREERIKALQEFIDTADEEDVASYIEELAYEHHQDWQMWLRWARKGCE
jgi:hypothetical protein